ASVAGTSMGRSSAAVRRGFMAPPRRLAPAVLPLVVCAELAGLERPPPRLVLAIPAHRRLQRGAERVARRPAQLPELGRVERVAAVVAGPVGHQADEAIGLAEPPQDLVRQGDVGHLVTAGDVVDVAVVALP